MIVVGKAPPFATVQDLGRSGHRHDGVPPSGAMDAATLARLNAALGNAPRAAGLEWALGEGSLQVEQPVTVALGPVGAHLDGVSLPPWSVTACSRGATLHLQPPSACRFGYLAVGGGIEVPLVLGSRSTYLPGRFGGLEGRRLRAGDRLPVGPAPHEARGLRAPDQQTDAIRVVRGPQADLFGAEAWSTLLGGQYSVGVASDRMGYRLEGPTLRHHGPASLPSEPACPGAIQVPDGGAPIVLMPDGPTVGGYPKIAVVISADLGRLAQAQPGTVPRFRLVSLEEAVRA